MTYGDELRRHDAERGADREGLADPLAVGDARARHEPALPVPELHRGLGQADRRRRRRTRTSRRRATTCSSSSTRTACPSVGLVHPPEPGAAVDRHDAADRLGRRRPRAGDRRRDGRTSRRTRPTTTRSRACSSSSTAPTSAPRTRSRRTRSPGTRRRQRERLAHADRGRARRRRQHRHVRHRCSVTVSNSGPPPGLVAAYGFDAGTGRDGRRPVGQRQQRHALERDLGGAAAGVRQRALLQRHERVRHRPRLERARPDDGDDARGVGATDRRSATWRTVVFKEQSGLLRLRALREHGQRPARAATAMIGGARPRHPRHGAAAAEHVDAPRRHLRRQRRSRLYVNGVQAATLLAHRLDRRRRPGPLKIGGNAIWGEWFTA